MKLITSNLINSLVCAFTLSIAIPSWAGFINIDYTLNSSTSYGGDRTADGIPLVSPIQYRATNIAAFDTSLGLLTSIRINIDGYLTGTSDHYAGFTDDSAVNGTQSASTATHYGAYSIIGGTSLGDLNFGTASGCTYRPLRDSYLCLSNLPDETSSGAVDFDYSATLTEGALFDFIMNGFALGVGTGTTVNAQTLAAETWARGSTSLTGKVSMTYTFTEVVAEVASEVPEPSTLTIFALGMIGLASRRFKKQP